jgi:hypothetical protein
MSTHTRPSLILLALTLSVSSWAKNLTESRYFNYEVLFTNPDCKTYSYDAPLIAQSGKDITSKTPGAYCKSSDSRRSGQRANSPHKRLLEWIGNKDTKEIFMSYLSFSKNSVAKALCAAIQERNVKVTLIVDQNNEADPHRMAKARFVSRCRPKNLEANEFAMLPKLVTRGGTGRGSKKIGYAHNKITIINPQTTSKIKISFSSGNMSSGTTTHHENWHFVTTHTNTHFAQAQLCLMKGSLDHTKDAKTYAQYVQKCRANIPFEQESDIQSYFIPGEGKLATSAIEKAALASTEIMGAAHRFSYKPLVATLDQAMDDGKLVRFIFDDDVYWTGVLGFGVGRNTLLEYGKVRFLERQGMKIKYIETHMDNVDRPKRIQLQHNKFLVFAQDKVKGSVFAGAGNFTGSAFKSNLENFYMIHIPQVYQAFREQYKKMWNKLSRSHHEMPKQLVLP